MSYDLDLCDAAGKVLEVPEKHNITGGTYVVGGTTELTLNITYNYGKHYYRVIDKDKGIRALYGLTGAEAIPILEKAINQLEDVVHDNYWEPTEGNARKALQDLVTLSKMRPDGIWRGD